MVAAWSAVNRNVWSCFELFLLLCSSYVDPHSYARIWRERMHEGAVMVSVHSLTQDSRNALNRSRTRKTRFFKFIRPDFWTDLNGCRQRLLFERQLIPRKCSLCSQGTQKYMSLIFSKYSFFSDLVPRTLFIFSFFLICSFLRYTVLFCFSFREVDGQWVELRRETWGS